MKNPFFAAGIILIVFFFSFNSSTKSDSIYLNKKAFSSFSIVDTAKPAKVQLEQTTIPPMFLLFIRDTAVTTESMNDIFNNDYGELMQFIQQNGLKPLKFISWYYSTQPPWAMDVAVETDQLPETVSGRIQARTQEGGPVLIAHIWGAYEQVGQAYLAIQKSLSEKNLKARAAPFEVYVTDPSTAKDPSEIQTDVYQPIE